jgi:DDE family transposase
MSSSPSLLQAFALVPDPRNASGRRYPLAAVLAFVATAMLAGARSLYAIAQFGGDRGAKFARAVGLTRGTTPCCATLHYLFKALDAEAFEAAIRRWSLARCAKSGPAMAFDGKTLCGATGVELPGVHLLSAYTHEAGQVLAQVRVGAKTNEHKAALELLGILPLAGRIVTGDAMFCQRDLSQEICKNGGDYLWTVKDNQPALQADIAAAFEKPFSPSRAALRCRRTAAGRANRQRPRTKRAALVDQHDHADRLS